MRIGTVLRLVLALAAAVLLPASAFAQWGDHCSAVCTESASCSTSCRTQTGPEQPGEEWSTCGEWGVCASSCVPDWQVIDSQPKGGYAVYYYTSPLRCDFYGTYLITERDVNQCGEPDRTWCFRRLEASRNDHRCCEFYFCSPNACYQP
jgi:hypothetical protein